MTVPSPRSGRWSVRGGSPDGPTTEFPRPYAHKAPESMSPSAPSRPAGPEHRRRLSAEGLRAVGEAINPRDRAILEDLNRFGFLTSRQIEAIHFGQLQAAGRICRRVIKRLADGGLLLRVNRRIGGFSGGSSTSIWRLSAAGYRLVNDGRRVRIKLPSDRFLDHRLAVADCYTQLVQQTRMGSLELLDIAPEPGSWRPYLSPSGQDETLKPDLYVVTATSDYEDHWFCEIDRGTESLPTIRKKCAQYIRYRRTGKEQQASGLFPFVVWVALDEQRADQLRRTVSAAHDMTAGIFRVTTSQDFGATVTGVAS